MKMNSEQKAALVKQMADLIEGAGDVCYEFRRPSVEDLGKDRYENATAPGPTVYLHLKLEMSDRHDQQAASAGQNTV